MESRHVPESINKQFMVLLLYDNVLYVVREDFDKYHIEEMHIEQNLPYIKALIESCHHIKLCYRFFAAMNILEKCAGRPIRTPHCSDVSNFFIRRGVKIEHVPFSDHSEAKGQCIKLYQLYQQYRKVQAFWIKTDTVFCEERHILLKDLTICNDILIGRQTILALNFASAELFYRLGLLSEADIRKLYQMRRFAVKVKYFHGDTFDSKTSGF